MKNVYRVKRVLCFKLFWIVLVSCFCCNACIEADEMKAQIYIDEFKMIAIEEMHRMGVPASIKLAQAMFESNFGRSDLAIRGNNHFGIKCYKSWKGGRLFYHDDKPNECFRQYDWVEDSYADHSRIITSKKRYASLFELAPIDYKGWAKGL